MEEVISAAGANPVDWNYKVECCGASHSIVHTEIVETLSSRILDDALNHKANVIAVACPMCHSNLDMRQKNIMKHDPGRAKIPILYLTQLVGLALGLTYKELAMDLHFIDPLPLMDLIEAKGLTV
jgi:heterodisulfide reductase subunit B